MFCRLLFLPQTCVCWSTWMMIFSCSVFVLSSSSTSITMQSIGYSFKHFVSFFQFIVVWNNSQWLIFNYYILINEGLHLTKKVQVSTLYHHINIKHNFNYQHVTKSFLLHPIIGKLPQLVKWPKSHKKLLYLNKPN